jgi:hypothetical protein
MSWCLKVGSNWEKDELSMVASKARCGRGQAPTHMGWFLLWNLASPQCMCWQFFFYGKKSAFHRRPREIFWSTPPQPSVEQTTPPRAPWPLRSSSSLATLEMHWLDLQGKDQLLRSTTPTRFISLLVLVDMKHDRRIHSKRTNILKNDRL